MLRALGYSYTARSVLVIYLRRSSPRHRRLPSSVLHLLLRPIPLQYPLAMRDQALPPRHGAHEPLVAPAHPLVEQQVRVRKQRGVQHRRPALVVAAKQPLAISLAIRVVAEQYRERLERRGRARIHVVDVERPRQPQLLVGGAAQARGDGGAHGARARGRVDVQARGERGVGGGEVEGVQPGGADGVVDEGAVGGGAGVGGERGGGVAAGVLCGVGEESGGGDGEEGCGEEGGGGGGEEEGEGAGGGGVVGGGGEGDGEAGEAEGGLVGEAGWVGARCVGGGRGRRRRRREEEVEGWEGGGRGAARRERVRGVGAEGDGVEEGAEGGGDGEEGVEARGEGWWRGRGRRFVHGGCEGEGEGEVVVVVVRTDATWEWTGDFGSCSCQAVSVDSRPWRGSEARAVWE